MKRLIMKFGFLMLLSMSIFAMPILADGDGNGNRKEGCTDKCTRGSAVCKEYCSDGTPVTELICKGLCDVQAVFCVFICPLAG